MRQGQENYVDWLTRIRQWAATRRDIFYLSSCRQPDAGNLGSYELIVAQGIRRSFVAEERHEVDWEGLRQFCANSAWTFFALSYDLNASLAGGLRGNRRDALGWPLLYAVEPEHVITVSRRGEVEIVSDNPGDLVREINAGACMCGHGPLSVQFGRMRDSMSRRDYLDSVARIREQIAGGSFYELNLCMETVIEDVVISSPFSLHQQLTALSPTPFSSYVQLGSMHLLAASPERFLKRQGNRIYSQPIKGTSARHADTATDQASRIYLATSPKERAEHVMIVDLMRNDLGRLCANGSISVPELCEIYGFRQVYQMVSTIVGECRGGIDFVDALQATFPMGSMTGAPKHRVMQEIERLEPAARGWYSGSVGYVKPDGDFDANVVIRSLLYDNRQHRAKYAVGGAITHDSDAESEYNECLLKSRAIRTLLESYANPAPDTVPYRIGDLKKRECAS